MRPRFVIAGGNGELLGQILRAAPHLRGVLLEHPHALEAARSTLAKGGCTDRCQLVVGDFTSGVPQGGDVYLLSRILHDWDRLAIPRGGLGHPHDVQRRRARRTTSHYRRMLSEAGFELTAQYELPWDVALLRASRREPATIRPHTYGDDDA